ncbi:MAG: phosphatidylglycerophosphatase A [Pseudomonadota bacterium]
MRPPRWALAVSTLGGIGFLKPAPGTYGSLAALPPAALLAWYGGVWALVLGFLAVTLLGIWSAALYGEATGRKDPPEVIIDEVAGQWLTLLPLTVSDLVWSWPLWLASFALFRLFDILKPWPCDPLERLDGGLGVMADDLMAGLYGALVMTLLLWFLGASLV